MPSRQIVILFICILLGLGISVRGAQTSRFDSDSPHSQNSSENSFDSLPLTVTPEWSVNGDQDGARLGFSVATAGDVDADGYSDLLVGAVRRDNGETDEGRVYLYRGSSSGILSTPSWSVDGEQEYALLGFAISSAGDVNGDGFSDALVGAPLFENGEPNEGRVSLYQGSPSGLSAQPDWIVESHQDGAQAGRALAFAGDVNADGYDDVLVGTPQYDAGQSDEGRAFLFLGSSSGLSLLPDWMAEGDQDDAWFGYRVATAGDVNGDGYQDALVGAYLYDNGETDEGRAFLYLGSSSGLDSTATWTMEIDQDGAHFGKSLSAAGDVNGDGFGDVIIGAPRFQNNQFDEGAAYVFYGYSGGLRLFSAWQAEGNSGSAGFGESVAGAGDLNGDGFADVVVGAFEFSGGETDEGKAFAYLGSSSGLSTTPIWTAEGNQLAARFGIAVASGGDVNGDGFGDLVVGASLYDNGATDEGKAFLYTGSALGPSEAPAWDEQSDRIGAFFGLSGSSVGDVNGDGFSDVVVGAYLFGNGQTKEGAAFYYAGSTSGLEPSPSWRHEGNQSEAWAGFPVAPAGDVNGDGFSDLVVGVSKYDGGNDDEGEARLFHGSASGFPAQADWSAQGDQMDARFGSSTATAGDVNGDGFADLLVGARLFDNGELDEGKAYLYLGSSSGLLTNPSWTAEGNQEGAEFGRKTSTAGDVNGDGYSDVIVGAPFHDNGEMDEGRAYLYLGSASGVSLTPDWISESDQIDARLGIAVSTAGDVNGDGFSDVLTGAHLYDNGEEDEGRVLLYLGSPSGLSAVPDWTQEIDHAFSVFGFSVAPAGDVNGDGFADVIIGAPVQNNGHVDEGLAYVYLGSSSGLQSTPIWTGEGDQFEAWFGWSVAPGGDVNGDGFADILVGASGFDNGETDEGKAFLFLGNVDGLHRIPRQARSSDSAPIDVLGRSDSNTSFRLKAVGRTPAGRGDVALEFEVKPLGVPFDGMGISTGSFLNTGFPSASGSFVDLNELVEGLKPGIPYHWRLRIVGKNPIFPRSPWLSLPLTSPTETSLRTLPLWTLPEQTLGSAPQDRGSVRWPPF